jgi:hypothetical protein
MALLSVAAISASATDTGNIGILKQNLFYHCYKSELLVLLLSVPLKK